MYTDNSNLNYRLISKYDDKILFKWFNSRDNLRFKLNTSFFIEYIKHKVWVTKRILSNTCDIWIIEEKGKKIGQVRIEVIDTNVNIDIFVEKKLRNRGFGKKILSFAVKQSKRKWKKKISVYISKYNINSIKLFKSVGFKLKGLRKSFYIFNLE